jgi:cytochrome c oxidase cbb3-type subunit 3
MSETKLRVHDGIVEDDNRLPYWWLATLWGAIFFGAGYWMYFQVTHTGPDQLAEYQEEMAALRSSLPAPPKPADEATLTALSKDADTVAAGQQLFSTTCIACHGVHGEGLVGPNLTDAYWIHGSKPTDIYKTVSEGVPAKGMPSWGKTLSEDKVRAAVAFVLTLKGKNLPGKPPQGELNP